MQVSPFRFNVRSHGGVGIIALATSPGEIDLVRRQAAI